MTEENGTKDSSLWPALLRAQQAIKPVTKSADNPFFHSKYAPLEDVLAAVLPALNAEGLVLQQPVVMAEWGWVVASRIVHSETGETTEAQFPLVTNGAKTQDIGAQITYGRRFGLSALLALATEDDDDGNRASSPPTRVIDERTKGSQMAPTQTPRPAPQSQPGATSKPQKRFVDYSKLVCPSCHVEAAIGKRNDNGHFFCAKNKGGCGKDLGTNPWAQPGYAVTVPGLDDEPPPYGDEDLPF